MPAAHATSKIPAATDRLRANWWWPFAHILTLLVATIFGAAGVWFALRDMPFEHATWVHRAGFYAAGQVLLALAYLKWFIVLHECGHGSFAPTRAANTSIGHLASVFALIPFHSWRLVHHQHHRWTGWRDVDPTTQSTVPRDLSSRERMLVRVSWRFWLPLFSVLYRVNNYWNLPRLRKLFSGSRHLPTLQKNLVGLGLLYPLLFIATALSVGLSPALQLGLFGWFVGFVFSLAFTDVILLSQHTHIDQRLALGDTVVPIPFAEQAPYTRSLSMSPFLAQWLLINFNLHEAHHIEPSVPGYLLHRLEVRTFHTHPIWTWTWRVKAIPADEFIFSTNADTHRNV